MPVATFDTLKFANTLKAAGVPDKQAEAQAVAFADVIQINLKDLVTKDDLKQEIKSLRDELKRDIADLRTELMYELKQLEQRLTSRDEAAELRHANEMKFVRWMMGGTFTVMLAVLGLVIRGLFLLSR